MNRFVAFLRAINVGGTMVIKMDELKRLFESVPLEQVATYIQSGNVIFESREKDARLLETRIERHLDEALGTRVEVFVRSMPEIVGLAAQKLFKPGVGDTLHIVFLHEVPDKQAARAVLAQNSKADEFAVKGREVYNLRHDRDQSVFTNNFIEKILKAAATTRNWNTICKIAEKYR